jgi:hypothetical protein
MVVQTAKMHGGELTIASTAGRGTAMTLWLAAPDAKRI